MDALPEIITSNTPNAVHLRFEKDTRYYELHLGKDLFDNWSITRVNGKIKTRLGQYRHEFFGSLDEAIKRVSDLSQYRVEKRKYKLVNYRYV